MRIPYLNDYPDSDATLELTELVRAHRNIIVAGPQYSGKTTLQRAILNTAYTIFPDTRFAMVERYFDLSAANIASYRRSFDRNSPHAVAEALLSHGNRPLSLSVDELAEDTAALLEAWATSTTRTGVAGLHATTPQEALERVCVLLAKAQHPSPRPRYAQPSAQSYSCSPPTRHPASTRSRRSRRCWQPSHAQDDRCRHGGHRDLRLRRRKPPASRAKGSIRSSRRAIGRDRRSAIAAGNGKTARHGDFHLYASKPTRARYVSPATRSLTITLTDVDGNPQKPPIAKDHPDARRKPLLPQARHRHVLTPTLGSERPRLVHGVALCKRQRTAPGPSSAA